MQIEVLYLEKTLTDTSIAFVAVRYYEIILNCDLVYHPKTKTAWVRMPEIWVSEERKEQYCFWDDQEISNNFQKEVLSKLFDKYDIDIKTLKDWHREGCYLRSMSKSIDNN